MGSWPPDSTSAEAQEKQLIAIGTGGPTGVYFVVGRSFGAKLHVMTVVPDFGMAIVGSFFPEGYERQALEEAGTALRDFVETNVPDEKSIARIHVRHGTIYKEILDTAKSTGIDLIVLAARRPEQSDYLLGPNAARIVRHANCSVMVVRD